MLPVSENLREEILANCSEVSDLFCTSGTDDGEDVEIPWWTYGARGMQLWFPKSLAEPVSHAAAAEAAHYMTDPELEFDREVYPISISLAEVSIIGAPALHFLITRGSRSATRGSTDDFR